MTGTIFDIKHYAIHDGPGIRQTIFFKGCPLNCWWCHNPESRSPEILSAEKEEMFGGEKLCVSEIIGKKYSVSELMNVIKKDIPFFEESQGGITLSGGEPLLQFDFAFELLSLCKKHEIHTCVDTTGYVTKEKLSEIAAVTDLFLYDLKHIDDSKHKELTGVGNELILSNLKLLEELGSDIWIRFPLIPGINDDEADLLRMMGMLSKLKKKYPITILPFHKIGKHKYSRFGIEYKMNDIQESDKDHINKILQLFVDAGFSARIGG